MKTFYYIFGILIVLGVGYWLISPFFITREVNEVLPTATPSAQVVSTGIFEGRALHNAEGDVMLLKIGEKYIVRFENNFKVTNGPDLFVYLGKDGAYDPDARLQALKGNIGSQNYEVSNDIDVTKYDAVWVWCRAFSVPFGEAVLIKSGGATTTLP